jgi:hypothetical protein
MSFTFSIDQSYFLRGTASDSIPSIINDTYNRNVEVLCSPSWYKHITLQWKIPPQWGNCTFNVYYSYGDKDDAIKLNKVPITSPYFKDEKEQEYSKFNTGRYIVEVVLPGPGKRIRSKPTSVENQRREHVDKIASEIQRREYMLLSKFVGVKSFYFKKRNFGERCARCWNESQEKVMDDHCRVCYGTSWQGGYFNPLPVYFQYDASSNSKVKSYVGTIEPNSISAWTISVPEMHPDDIILRSGDFAIYKIISVSQTELQTKAVRQTVSLTQLSKSDVENELADRTESIYSFTYLNDLGGVFNKERFPTNLLDADPKNDPDWVPNQNVKTLPKYELPN